MFARPQHPRCTRMLWSRVQAGDNHARAVGYRHGRCRLMNQLLTFLSRAQPSMNRMRSRLRLFALAASVSIGVAASCSSDDQAPGGGRVEHPVEPGPKVAPGPSKAPPPPSSIAAPEASAAAPPSSPVERCAAVWSCAPNYGQRCESNKDCLYTPCVDGRCRSCTSDAECETLMDVSPTTCRPDPDVPNLRECSGIASKMGIITRAPQGNGASDAGP
jgi:hypothetical protein